MLIHPRYLLRQRLPLILIFIIGSFHSQAEPVAEQLYQPTPKEMRLSLAQSGAFPVGVRTVTLVHPDQLDLNSQQRVARKLTVELWYPATSVTDHALANYPSMTKSGQPFVIKGNAYRNLAPAAEKLLPVVVLSHGYPGNRTLMFYLAEHLASHGYLVAAIDHPHSTYGEIDQKNAPYQGFLNTLYHRSRDQQFVLDALRQPGNPDLAFIVPYIDGNSAALIGYSMGGYGALNTIGGCYAFTTPSIAAFTGVKDGATNQALQQTLNSCAGGQKEAKVDPAWKAAIAIAPWGGQHQLFSAAALKQLTVPLMFWAGDQDEVSGYQGMRSLYEMAGSKHKYFLTYHHAGHNIAPHPAPAVSRSLASDFAHYHEASWATDSINDLNRHFALAMLDCHVKAITAQCAQLKLQAPSILWPGYRKGLPTGLSWMSSTGN
jgi:predicted dienelactone hydrolase